MPTWCPPQKNPIFSQPHQKMSTLPLFAHLYLPPQKESKVPTNFRPLKKNSLTGGGGGGVVFFFCIGPVLLEYTCYDHFPTMNNGAPTFSGIASPSRKLNLNLICFYNIQNKERSHIAQIHPLLCRKNIALQTFEHGYSMYAYGLCPLKCIVL